MKWTFLGSCSDIMVLLSILLGSLEFFFFSTNFSPTLESETNMLATKLYWGLVILHKTCTRLYKMRMIKFYKYGDINLHSHCDYVTLKILNV